MTETMLQTVLEEDELLYLLETLSAKHLWGIDNAHLFPTVDIAADSAREPRLARGLALLKEHGWLLPAEHNTWNMNATLMLMIVVVADPEIVVTTTYFPSMTTKAALVCYLAERLIIELAPLENSTYRLTSLPSFAFLLERLSQALSLPSTSAIENMEPILVSNPSSQQIATDRADTTLTSSPIGANNTPLVQALTGAHLLAKIAIDRASGDDLLSHHELTLLAANGEVWLAQYTDEAKHTISIEPLTATSFSAKLAFIIKLLQMKLETI